MNLARSGIAGHEDGFREIARGLALLWGVGMVGFLLTSMAASTGLHGLDHMRLVPRRSAPRATKSRGVLEVGDAAGGLDLHMRGDVRGLNRATSSRVAPPPPKPVEVLMIVRAGLGHHLGTVRSSPHR